MSQYIKKSGKKDPIKKHNEKILKFQGHLAVKRLKKPGEKVTAFNIRAVLPKDIIIRTLERYPKLKLT